MEESKLSLYQQRQIDWCLRSGSSLADAKQELRQKRTSSAPTLFKSPPKESRRRTLLAIKSSGDFDREKFRNSKTINFDITKYFLHLCSNFYRFRSNQRNEDRDLIKSRLQEIMEFGKKQESRQKVCLKIDPKNKFGERRLPGQYEILQDC